MDSFAKGAVQARYVPLMANLLYFPHKQLDLNYFNNNYYYIDHTAKNLVYIKMIKSTIKTIPKETVIGHTV